MGIIVRKGNNDEFFRTFRDMQRDVDSIFDGVLSGRGNNKEMCMMPRVDVFGSEKEYTFEFELPGFKKEDVKVNVEDNILTVSGEISKETDENVKNYHVSERRFGSFKRQFSLPEDSDLNQISAKYNDGILMLTVQKKEEEKKQNIEIEIK